MDEAKLVNNFPRGKTCILCGYFLQENENDRIQGYCKWFKNPDGSYLKTKAGNPTCKHFKDK